MTAVCAALLLAAPVAGGVTAGFSATAGVALHDGDRGGADPVAATRAFFGPRVSDHIAVVLAAQFAWTREQSHDEEFPGAWATHFALGGMGVQLETGPLALQVGVGATWKRRPHWPSSESGLAFFAAASVAVWRGFTLDASVTRFGVSNTFQPGATVVSGGLGVSF